MSENIFSDNIFSDVTCGSGSYGGVTKLKITNEIITAAGRAFCQEVVDEIHRAANARGGSNSMSGSEYYSYPPSIQGFDKAMKAAIDAAIRTWSMDE